MTTQKIGIFSGTFDPIHKAHLRVCEMAIESCNLLAVFIVVEKLPYKKPQVTEYQQRVKMIKLAIGQNPKISLLETNKDNITVDNILPLLRSQMPNAEYWYIVGSDLIEYLPTWQNVGKILNNFKLGIVLRRTKDKTKTEAIFKKLKQENKILNYKILPEVSPTVSSSKIRSQIKSSRKSQYLSKDVLNYINTNNIYSTY